MDKKDVYRTIMKQSSGSFRDRGSKFLAFAYHVRSVEEVKGILANLRKEYHDARHHCYAYVLGADQSIYRANDDGEPSSSAGKPILGQIKAFELSNVLVVVVRYFGGTLLGVGGLIQAYRSAARDSLQKADIIQMTEDIPLDIHFPYTALDRVMRILDEEKTKIVAREFTETCRIQASVRKSRASVCVKKLESIAGAKVVNSY